MNTKTQFNEITFQKTEEIPSENHIEKIYDELVEEFGQPLINKLMHNLYDKSNDKQGLLSFTYLHFLKTIQFSSNIYQLSKTLFH